MALSLISITGILAGSVFKLYFVFYFLHYLLSKTKLKNSSIDKFLLGKCNNYKYGFYLRFWIQAYIEIFVSCILAFYSYNFDTVNQALNFYFATIFGVSIT